MGTAIAIMAMVPEEPPQMVEAGLVLKSEWGGFLVVLQQRPEHLTSALVAFGKT